MKGASAYAGGLALGLITIPLIARTTEEMLALVPNSYREAALALGIPKTDAAVIAALSDTPPESGVTGEPCVLHLHFRFNRPAKGCPARTPSRGAADAQ